MNFQFDAINIKQINMTNEKKFKQHQDITSTSTTFKTLRNKMVILMFVPIDLVAKWLKDRACEPQVTTLNPPKVLFIFTELNFLNS